MSAGIFSRTVKSVSELFGPHLKSQALNAISRLSRSLEQLLRVGCHGKDAKDAPLALIHFADNPVGMDEFATEVGGKYLGFPEEILNT